MLGDYFQCPKTVAGVGVGAVHFKTKLLEIGNLLNELYVNNIKVLLL